MHADGRWDGHPGRGHIHLRVRVQRGELRQQQQHPGVCLQLPAGPAGPPYFWRDQLLPCGPLPRRRGLCVCPCCTLRCAACTSLCTADGTALCMWAIAASPHVVRCPAWHARVSCLCRSRRAGQTENSDQPGLVVLLLSHHHCARNHARPRCVCVCTAECPASVLEGCVCVGGGGGKPFTCVCTCTAMCTWQGGARGCTRVLCTCERVSLCGRVSV